MIKRSVLVSIAMILGGCGSGEVHDVQYFIDHPEERKEMFEKCQSNPGKLRETPECINVFAAAKEVMLQEIQQSVTRDK